MSEEQSPEVEEAPKPKAYISAPGYNNPQMIGSEKIVQVIRDAGYEPVLPEVTTEIPPREEAERALGQLRDADLVVSWLDGLPEKGVSVYTVGNVQTKVSINFPPEAIEMMQYGAVAMKKMGKGQKKKGIVLPHEIDSPPPIPMGMDINYEPHGLALCGLVGRPMNFPDVSVSFEVGYAFATGKPIISLAMVDPIIGMYLGWTSDVVVETFGNLKNALVAFRETALNKSPGERRKMLAQIQETFGLNMLKAAQARAEAAAKAREDTPLPPEEPKKDEAKDGADAK